MSIQYTADQLQRKFQGPSGSSGFARLAEGLRIEGRLDEAIQVCEDGLRLRPFQLSGYLVLGKALIDSGRLEEAREQFEGALRLDPRCLSAMHSLADIMNKLQWGEAAAGYYRSILEVEPWDSEIRALLGQPSSDSRFAPKAPRDYSPVSPAGEGTFHKPEGLSGDVMEINLNDAVEFLPDRDGGATSLSDDDISLEDALALQPSHDPTPAVPSAPEFQPEPAPRDILPDAPSESEMEASDEPAPISGQDVEDRIDSLFGPDEPAPSVSRSFSAAADLGDATTIQTDIVRLPEVQGDTVGDEERVSGEDIEKRLDDLFSLTEQDNLPPAARGDAGKPAFDSVETGVFLSTETGSLSKLDALALAGETTGAALPVDDSQEPELMGLAAAENPSPSFAREDLVTGEDVAEKLDDIFGAEPATEERAADKSARADGGQSAWSPGGSAETQDHPATSETDKAHEPETAAPSGDSAIMSTESMLPMGWLEDAGEQPRITGADIEAQLDKLFQMEGESDGMDSAQASGNIQDTDPFQAMPGDEADRTVTMPAMKDSGLKESVSDWLAQQSAQGKARPMDAGDTLFMPSAEAGALRDLDATPEFPLPQETAKEPEPFGTLAQEDATGLTDTATIEMIDGADIAERLDELFADEREAAAEASSANALETSDSEAMVTGEEVASRLSEIFETAPGAVQTGGAGIADDAEAAEMPFSLETAEETANRPVVDAQASRAAQPSQPLAPELAPMQDEEDGYPEDEEMPSEGGTGTNVATVTLAEIYFQQGLKEQALQIYRQLLEREPENAAVRKRIEEIEASKPDGENRDPDGQRPDTDPRRPRPGLKVPKRKK